MVGSGLEEEKRIRHVLLHLVGIDFRPMAFDYFGIHRLLPLESRSALRNDEGRVRSPWNINPWSPLVRS